MGDEIPPDMDSEMNSRDSGTIEADRDEERSPNTFFNALIGAIVSVVLGFIPFSPVLGGGIAGYLEGGDSRDGAKLVRFLACWQLFHS